MLPSLPCNANTPFIVGIIISGIPSLSKSAISNGVCISMPISGISAEVFRHTMSPLVPSSTVTVPSDVQSLGPPSTTISVLPSPLTSAASGPIRVPEFDPAYCCHLRGRLGCARTGPTVMKT